MSNGILRVDGEKIVDAGGKPVLLRGTALGGWMNMENFITGFPGHESTHRASMLAALGQEKYDFFFDKFLEYYFMEEDAKFFKSLGLNCLRLPFNYRHLEDDMNPRVLKEGGFKHLDRVIDLCAKHEIYTILDMHTLPGGQSPGWHSDNTTSYAAFWDYLDHQNRTIWLWQQIAARYKSNAWVAGYNPINEPCDPQHVRLPAFYARFEKAIREVDNAHILFLDGNTFAAEWRGFDQYPILPNCVYSLHDYSLLGFPGPDQFDGTQDQLDRLERQFLRKADFHRSRHAPIWNGEWGPVYANPQYEVDAASTNEKRYNLLGAQLRIYDKYNIPWSIWLYKDIGVQGMLHTSPSSPWNKLLGPFLQKKKALQLDAWGKYPSEEIDALLAPVAEWIDKVSPTAKDTYPSTWPTRRHLERSILEMFLSESFHKEFSGLFAGKSIEDLDELAKSFSYGQCVQRKGLNDILSQHAATSTN